MTEILRWFGRMFTKQCLIVYDLILVAHWNSMQSVCLAVLCVWAAICPRTSLCFCRRLITATLYFPRLAKKGSGVLIFFPSRSTWWSSPSQSLLANIPSLNSAKTHLLHSTSGTVHHLTNASNPSLRYLHCITSSFWTMDSMNFCCALRRR